jgi:hypothetical protein
MYRSNWERLSKTRYTQFAQFSRTVVILPLSAHPYLSDAKLPRFLCVDGRTQGCSRQQTIAARACDTAS